MAIKVLQVTKYYPPQFGGIESATFDVTEGLNRSGEHCDVLCSSPSLKTTIETVNGYKIYRMGSWMTLSATSIAPSLIMQLKKLKKNYDIIHVHFPNPMAALALYLVRPECKVVIHWHSDIIKQRKMYVFYRYLERWALDRADAIIATSENYLSHSRPLCSYLHKTSVVPLGISTERFSCKQQDFERLQNEFAGKKVIFSLGRLVYYKGFEYLVRAAKHLNKDTVVIIGGTGELKGQLEELIKQEQLQDKVKLPGRISEDEVACYFKICDIFCLPSTQRSEAFGVVQLEAMYFGKPIIATNVPGSGVNWVNLHEITGINVPVRDSAALARAITKILDTPELQQSFSKNSYERFRKQFTREHMVGTLKEVYSALFARKVHKQVLTPHVTK